MDAPHADAAMGILERRWEDIRVLFTEVDMPDSMNGVALAERVAKARPHIGLVVASGQRRLAVHEVPASGRFLSKPYRPAELMRVIREAA